MTYTDQQLNAFLDNQLEDYDMQCIREALIEDERLSERLEGLVYVDSLVQSAYADIDSEPLSQGIINLLSEINAPKKAHFLVGFNEIVTLATGRSFRLTMALLLVVGAWTVSNNVKVKPSQIITSVLNSGPVDPEGPIHMTLENVPSTVGAKLDQYGHRVLTPILSFENNQGQYCREMTLHTASTSSRSVACRQNNKLWNIELSALQKSQVLDNEYATASSISPRAFENYINQIIKDEPFSAEQELKLLEMNWK
jgi:hypothetical protein